MSGAVISNVRPLSMDDARALSRIPRVLATVPVVQGNAAVEFGSRSRRTYVFGVDADAPAVWQLDVAQGRFLPDDEAAGARALAVLGSKVSRELFGTANPLGRRIRIGGERYRTIGVMAAKGQMLGFDLDDAVYIPASRALSGPLRSAAGGAGIHPAVSSRLSAVWRPSDLSLPTRTSTSLRCAGSHRPSR